MTFLDYLLLAIVVFLVALALRSISRHNSSCHGCCGVCKSCGICKKNK